MPYIGTKAKTFNTFTSADVKVTDDLTVTDDASVGGDLTVNNIIQTTTSDGDMVFKGNDGGSTITALTLDMSDAGTATFNHDVKLPDSGELILGAGSDIRLYHDGSNSYLKSSTNNLFISSAASLILDADGSGDFIFRDSDIGDEANKVIRFSTPSHDTNEENVQILQVESEASSNQITFGGGTSGLNASTKMIFRTAAIDTTTGSNRLDIDSSGNVVFNEDGADADFRIESNDDANMFVVNAGSNVVLVGHNTSVDTDGVVPDFQNHSTTHGAISTHRYSANASAPQIIIGKSRSGSLGGNTVLQSGDYCGILGWHGNDGNGFHEAGQIAVIVQSGVGNNDIPADMVYQTNSGGTGTTERFRIAANGDLTATDTSIGSNSDERLKKDIADFSYDLETFKKYKVRKFNWKQPDLHMNKTNQMGFVAQELQDVDSQWVSTTTLHSNNKGEAHPEAQYVNSDLSAFTAKLGEKDAMYISIIQQLTTKIETLQELEVRIKALEDA